MDKGIKILDKNRHLHKDLTYSCMMQTKILTKDVWLSKLGTQTVYAVMFTKGRKILGVWDAECGKLRGNDNPDSHLQHFIDPVWYKKYRAEV